MDFEDSGIDSDQRIDNNSDFIGGESRLEPIISFSPDRSRFDTQFSTSSGISTNAVTGGGGGGDEEDKTILSFAKERISLGLGQDSGCISVNMSEEFGPFPDVAINVGEGKSLIEYSPKLEAKSESNSRKSGKGVTFLSNSNPTTDLQRRLEKRIARANSSSGSIGENGVRNPPESISILKSPNSSSYASKRGGGTGNKHHLVDVGKEGDDSYKNSKFAKTSAVGGGMNSSSPGMPKSRESSSSNADIGSSSSGGFQDGRKTAQLIPPQRLAIPNKSSQHANSNITGTAKSLEGSHSENKPLVQWDSDESEEEELTFFPHSSSKRGTLNDNMSIDNMSLSGEEDDLHLSPPRPLSQRCPCDPRLLFDTASSSRRPCSIL